MLTGPAAEFLLVDLDIALTLMDVAAHSQNAETVRRRHEKARQALVSVLQLRKKLVLDEAQERAFYEKVTLLKTRLHGVGIRSKRAWLLYRVDRLEGGTPH